MELFGLDKSIRGGKTQNGESFIGQRANDDGFRISIWYL